MQQDRLSHLTLMSIEYDTLRAVTQYMSLRLGRPGERTSESDPLRL